MEHINLQHLKPLAFAAYNAITIYPHKKAELVIKEYTAELNADIRRIRQSAGANSNQENISAIVSKYSRKYEDHLTTWLKNGRTKYVYFREWRGRALKVIAKSIHKKVNNVNPVKEKIKVRNQKQRIITDGKTPRKRL